MKKILICIIISVICQTPVFAGQGYVYTSQNTKNVSSNQKPFSSKIPYGEYLQFYNLNADEINAEFIYLTHSDESTFLKSLTSEEKENYKYVIKRGPARFWMRDSPSKMFYFT
jgi:hypothetical protein